MTNLRDIAVAGQDFDLGAFIREVEDKQAQAGTKATDFTVLKELVDRLLLAESQLATVTAATDPETSDALTAADFVLECDVDECEAWHPDGERGTTAGDEEDDDDDERGQPAGLEYVSSSRVVAHAVHSLSKQLHQLKAANEELTRRNALLRSRRDLPADRTPAGQKYEAKIRELMARSKRCVFCNTPMASARELREHSEKCQFHPLYIKANTPPVPSVQMSAHELAEIVCEHLPQGYTINLAMEAGSCEVILLDDQHMEVAVEDAGLNTAEKITLRLNEARKTAGQPPITVPVSLPKTHGLFIAPKFGDVGWPVHLLKAKITVGSAGLLVKEMALRSMLSASPFHTALTLFGVVGPDGLLASFVKMLIIGDAKLEFIDSDGNVMPLLEGCSLDTCSPSVGAGGMAITEAITIVAKTPIEGTDWMKHKTTVSSKAAG